MKNNNLTEYADYLLQVALRKEKNISDAEEMVQETLLAALLAIEQGKTIDNLKNWLVTVLYRKYYDKLRQKYRKPTVSMDVIAQIPYEDNCFGRLEQSNDAEKIRCCLAYLTKLYREVMVRFYMRGQSVSQISMALNIPENTVKSRLDTGRKHIRKDFIMENYEKQSYEPDNLWLSNSGQCGINDEPFSLVQSDKISMNLLILAYNHPVTVPELAKAIGISTTYIEPIIEKLVEGELMNRVSNKVYTDFIIYTEKDRTVNLELEKELAVKLYKYIWVIMEQGLNELREQKFYQSQGDTKQIKLESFFVVKTLQTAVNNVRDEASGGNNPFELCPDRPNGGKWYAMGNRYSDDYNLNDNTYHKYFISGEANMTLEDYCGLKRISLCEYDCELGKTHQGYNSSNYMKNPMNQIDVMKMLYAIYSGKEDDLPVIDINCFKNISGLEKLNFLQRDEDERVVVDIPVISMDDRWKLYQISEMYSNIISEKLHDEFMKLMKTPIKLPKHLKSVPEWQRYMYSCSTFSMQVILRAKRDGWFLKNYNHDNYPVPAIFLAIER